MSLSKAIFVRPESGFRLFIRFKDGNEGIVDLSNLAGKGVFAAWNKGDLFEKVYIDSTGAIAWNEELDICSDALYERLVNKENATN